VSRRRGDAVVGAVLVALVAVVGLVGAAACSGSGSSKTRVYVFGDSLVFQSTPYITKLIDERGGYDSQVASLAGTATCDWFPNITMARDQFHPTIVAMAFSGNALGKCMLHANGTALSRAEYIAKYTADTKHVIAIFGPHVTIDLVGTPVNGAGDRTIADIYRRLAPQYPNTHFVDGGKYVTPGDKFAMTLPCLPGEPCTGPIVRGVRNDIVRSPDKAHFCPVDPGFGKPCKIYASGAYRFALAIVQGIEAATK